MRFVNPIPFVRDIDASKRFYRDLLGLKVVRDHGDFVLFESGFAIHDGGALEKTIWGSQSDDAKSYGRGNLLLYFEHDDVDQLFRAVGDKVRLIHPVENQAWGQRV